MNALRKSFRRLREFMREVDYGIAVGRGWVSVRKIQPTRPNPRVCGGINDRSYETTESVRDEEVMNALRKSFRRLREFMREVDYGIAVGRGWVSVRRTQLTPPNPRVCGGINDRSCETTESVRDEGGG